LRKLGRLARKVGLNIELKRTERQVAEDVGKEVKLVMMNNYY